MVKNDLIKWNVRLTKWNIQFKTTAGKEYDYDILEKFIKNKAIDVDSRKH